MAFFSDKNQSQPVSATDVAPEPLLRDIDDQMASARAAGVKIEVQGPFSSSAPSPHLTASNSHDTFFFLPTKHHVTIMVALLVLGTLGYGWASQHWLGQAGSETNSSGANTAQPAVTPMAQVPVFSEGAVEQQRMVAVQTIAKALANCVQSQPQKLYIPPCDNAANLIQSEYLTDNQADIQVAVSGDKQAAIAYTKLTALALNCESGTGADHYFVYRTVSRAYHIECLDGLPTP